MNNLIEIFIPLVNTIFDHTSMFLSALSEGAGLLSDGIGLSAAGNSVTIALAAGIPAYLPEGIMALVRRWRGSIDEKFANLDNVVNHITAHQPAWPIPATLLAQLTDHRDRLQALIDKCRTPDASQTDRLLRNALLKATVDLCRRQVKMWAYGQSAAGVLTAEDVHLLGFLLPGETGGHRSRSEATNVHAEVKVSIVSEDIIRVVIDHAAGENAAAAVHGWPKGVRNALIVIYAADGATEVLRTVTTRLHNDIRMPAGSHGKQFIIKASFLKHVDDMPRFGNAPTFSMPLSTTDLAASHGRQHQEERDAYRQENERLRQEIERLKEELRTKS
jgi:hypothetical protein